MANWGECDFRALRQLHERIKQAANPARMDSFYIRLLDDTTNQLLNAVKEATPPGPSGHLKRGWYKKAVRKQGDVYGTVLYNNVEYAPWVENGHRQTPGRYVPAIGKRLVRSWVEGKYMLRNSVREYQRNAPAHIQQKSEEFLREITGAS